MTPNLAFDAGRRSTRTLGITTLVSAAFIVQSFSAPRSLRKEHEMKIESLGHVVLKVRNQDRAEAFYHGLLGLPIAARWAERKMTFFTLGHHHDFAIAATGDHSPEAPDNSPGLLHVAFRVGQGIEDLRAAKAQLEASGIEVIARDHLVSKSIYFKDPDGNTVELYVDTSDVWKQHPEAVARSDPLDL